MVSAAGELAITRTQAQSLGDRIRRLLLRSEALRGYLLLSPTLLVMFVLLIAPMGGLIGISFCTQVYFTLDCTPTLQNYWTIIKPTGEWTYFLGFIPLPVLEAPIYVMLLVRSIMMSL